MGRLDDVIEIQDGCIFSLIVDSDLIITVDDSSE
jgi:hypothetical protein